MATWGKIIGGIATVAAIGFSVWGLDKLDIIDRHAFEWGDFATLTTGFFAVAGAVWVGLRQVAITERQANISDQQTKILDKQITLQSLSFKADLYDKRIKVFSDVKAYADTIWHEDMRTGNAFRDYIIALEGSNFLFGEEVHTKFRDIEKDITYFVLLKKKLANDEQKDLFPTGRLLTEQLKLSDNIRSNVKELQMMIVPYLRVDEHG